MKVRTHQRGGYNVIHNIEVTPWHVRGWVNGRCLTHGLEGPHIDTGDATKTAIGVAQACCRGRAVPFHQDREIAPITADPATA